MRDADWMEIDEWWCGPLNKRAAYVRNLPMGSRGGGQWVRRLQRRLHRAVVQRLRHPLDSSHGSAGTVDALVALPKQKWLSILYGTIINRKRSRELLQSERITSRTIPVISVGNVTFGATGKSPLLLHLAEMVTNSSERSFKPPMLLTRGYGDDEWKQFASAFPKCKLAIGSDRKQIGSAMAKRFADEISCVLLDDGLQQWKIAKDLEIVMVDALHPFGNGQLIPHGSLRERPEHALARADIVIIHHANLLPDGAIARVIKQIHLYASMGAPAKKQPLVATSQLRVVGLNKIDKTGAILHTRDQDHELQGKVALVCCGVGNPESVQLVVGRMNCWHRVVMESFPDHHAFTASDLSEMRALAQSLERETGRLVVLLTTEKDFFRSQTLFLQEIVASDQCELRVIECALELLQHGDLVQNRVLGLLSGG